jgi:hypothetical protein
VDRFLDEGDGPVGAGGHCLNGGPGEPEHHGSSGDQSQKEGGVHEGEILDAPGQVIGQPDDDREDHGGGAHDRGSDENGLRRCLERVAGSVVVLEEELGPLPARSEAEVAVQLLVDAVEVLDP